MFFFGLLGQKQMKNKKKLSQQSWEKTPEYREAVLLKVLRAMKNYGYCSWMKEELSKINLSI